MVVLKNITRVIKNDFIYIYREVKCPWCDHVFMWNKNGGEGLTFHEYKVKLTGAYAERAKCPSCEMAMLVLDHVFEGVDFDDDRVEKLKKDGKVCINVASTSPRRSGDCLG